METGQKYNIVYADPPWRYDNKRVQGGAEKHYGTMSTEEICRLPVSDICAENCTLFLWVIQNRRLSGRPRPVWHGRGR